MMGWPLLLGSALERSHRPERILPLVVWHATAKALSRSNHALASFSQMRPEDIMDQPGSSDQLVPKEIKATAADIVPALKEEAGKLADKSVAGGAEAAQAVGKAAESAAQVLDDALPALAGYVRNAAEYTNKFADSLRDKKAEELLGE